MLILAYCAGLRLGEIVRLVVGDIDLPEGTIEIRGSKFFKSRRLPLSASVMTALRTYLDARSCAGAPCHPHAPLFWHKRGRGGYSQAVVWILLTRVLREAGLKPAAGREGPHIHSLRHCFAVHRLTAWYRDGIDPQPLLPYLATFLGHKEIRHTLVYLTITEELLQKAGDRFHSLGAKALQIPKGGNSCD
jgi:site-specific recombinase XerD